MSEDSLIYNTKLAYAYLRLANNHLLCIEHKLSNYQNNKVKDLRKSVDKCFKSLEHELDKNNEMEDIENLLLELHETIDKLL